MPVFKSISAAALGFGLALAASGASAADDCAPLDRDFATAVAHKSIPEIEKAAKALNDDIVCGGHSAETWGRFVRAMIAIAKTDPAQRSEALEKASKKLDGVSVGDWRIAEELGNYYWAENDRKNAFDWYERAINFLNSHPAQRHTPAELQKLLNEAAYAKSDEKSGQGQIQFSQRDPLGGPAGIFAPVREAVPVSVPLPVRFIYDKAEFTPEGAAAVKELAEAARDLQLRELKLVGHTDDHGSDAYNMELSKRRVEAVRDELKKNHVAAHITIDWKGKREPIDANVMNPPPRGEELQALERRVEWVRGPND